MPNPTIDRTDEGPRAPTLKKRRSPKIEARVTKQTQLIRMLRAPTGVSVARICSKLGWQAHTTRAALSRLRQAGFLIVRERPSNDKPARYRIVSPSGSDGRLDAK